MRRATSAAGTSPEVRRGAKRARHALACSVPRAVNPSPSTHTTATSHPPVDREDRRLRLCALEFSTAMIGVSPTVASTIHRTSPIRQSLRTWAPVRVTLPVQLTFGRARSSSSLSRARKSSTTGTFYERDRHGAPTRTICSIRSRCSTARTRAQSPPLTSTCPIWAPSHPTLHLDCARSRACPVPLGTAQTASSSQRTVPPAGTTSRRSARSRRASRQSRAPRRASRSSFSQLGGTLKINETRVCWSFATDVRVMWRYTGHQKTALSGYI